MGEPSTVTTLGELLRELRRRQARRDCSSPLSYRELAARTGWPHGIIGDYFAGRLLPPTDRFDALVRLLGATPAEQAILSTARHQAVLTEVFRLEVPRQLPADVAAFAGRAGTIARLDQLMSSGRPILISGTAGVGKTALAVHYGHRIADRFPDGQLFLDLRGADPSGSPTPTADAQRMLLAALGVPDAEVPADPAGRTGLYRGLLADRQLLLLLDNVFDADQVRSLLPAAGDSVALLTSRSELGGVLGVHPVALGPLDRTEARALLAGRIGTERTAAEPAAVDRLIAACARLPLALTVASARAALHPSLSLTQLATEVRQGTTLRDLGVAVPNMSDISE